MLAVAAESGASLPDFSHVLQRVLVTKVMLFLDAVCFPWVCWRVVLATREFRMTQSDTSALSTNAQSITAPPVAARSLSSYLLTCGMAYTPV